MDDESHLRLVLSDAEWGSTIRLADQVTPDLGGTWRSELSPSVPLYQMIGRTFDLFDWANPLEPATRSTPLSCHWVRNGT